MTECRLAFVFIVYTESIIVGSNPFRDNDDDDDDVMDVESGIPQQSIFSRPIIGINFP